MSSLLLRRSALFVLSTTATLLTQATAASDAVTISANVPPDAPRVTIALTGATARDQHSGGPQSRQIASEAIPPALSRHAEPAGFRFYMDLGNDPGGRQHHLLGRPADELNFLSSSGSRTTPLEVLVLRQSKPGTTDYEPVTSGLLTIGTQNEIPFSYPAPRPLGTNALSEISGVLSFSISGSSGNQYNGHLTSRTGLSFSGSTFLSNSKLTVSLNPVTDLTPGLEQQVRLTLEPHSPDVPSRNATGKASELLTLGPAKLAVESIASDFSRITLAAVHGELAQAESEEAVAVPALPAISQVELFDRRTLSSNDLLAPARESGWLVLVFGEFKGEGHPGYSSGPQASANLNLPARAIQSIVNQDLATPPALAFVVRTVDLRLLFSEFLNGRPDYLLIADFADPTQVRFQMPSPHGGGGYYPGYPPGSTPPTFRQILNLPDNKVSVVVFDSSGKVRFLKADAGENLQAALLEASAMMKEGSAPRSEVGDAAPEASPPPPTNPQVRRSRSR